MSTLGSAVIKPAAFVVTVEPGHKGTVGHNAIVDHNGFLGHMGPIGVNKSCPAGHRGIMSRGS